LARSVFSANGQSKNEIEVISVFYVDRRTAFALGRKLHFWLSNIAHIA